MSITLFSLIPDLDSLLSLEPEELAGPILEVLNSIDHRNTGQLNLNNFVNVNSHQQYPQGRLQELQEAVTEAWVWLEREGLLAPRPGHSNGFVFVTRRGRRLQNSTGIKAYRSANLLPKEQLHPTIALKVWSSFLRGDYDTAVFQAFKEVEVAVRKAGSFSATDIGTNLMRKAFEKEKGPLSDQGLTESEKDSMAHFFAGAIGLYKNPSSHRNVEIGAVEAAEVIVIASHLMRIVDDRDQSS